ncbi:MAG: hypothetical protein GX066_06165 [Clostridiaceae bacterium]|nr:hypothetical protein [Clostridiaceae bacterium]
MEAIITWVLIYLAGVFLKNLFSKRNAIPVTPVKKKPSLNKNKTDKHIVPPIISTPTLSFPKPPPLGDSSVISEEDVAYREKTGMEYKDAAYREETGMEYDGIEFNQSTILNGIILSEILGAPKAMKIRK